MGPRQNDEEKEGNERCELSVSLSKSDLAILNRFRGEMSPDEFLAAILRMLDSKAVSATPGWIFKPSGEKGGSVGD